MKTSHLDIILSSVARTRDQYQHSEPRHEALSRVKRLTAGFGALTGALFGTGRQLKMKES